jgi:crotonobetainyl-CoA:carnitine CoA-transferase CaiB-like acyl-CoA transferase
MAAPYDDLTVLELGESIAPAYVGKQLADLGASVFRIDDPTGSGLYGMPPIVGKDPDGRPVGAAYLHLCRNKQSIALDLSTELGRAALSRLLDKADVVVDGLGVDRLAQQGFPHEKILRRQGTILTSITPFGLSGPYRDLHASDLTVLALGGLLNLVGDPGREPLSLAGSQAQYATGICAFTGTAAALLNRDRTGRGQLVDVSAMQSIAFLEWKSGSNYESTGAIRHRVGDRSQSLVLRTRDGWFGLLYTDPNWPQIQTLTGVAELSDERFSTRAGRVAHADELRELLRDWFAQRTKLEIYHAAQALKIPAGMVATIDDLLDSPQYAAREFWQSLDHPATGPLRYTGPGYRIRGLDYAPPARRAPLLGEHTDAGLADERLSAGSALD